MLIQKKGAVAGTVARAPLAEKFPRPKSRFHPMSNDLDENTDGVSKPPL